MSAMEIAFEYAKRQLFGMRFERFRYDSNQTRLSYEWNGQFFIKLLCLFFLSLGFQSVAYSLFSRTVRIYPVEPKALALMKNLLYQDDGQLIIDYEYDEVDLIVTRVVVYNTSGHEYNVKVRSTNTGMEYSLVIPQGTIDQPVPQDIYSRLALTMTPSGKLDGIEWEIYAAGA